MATATRPMTADEFLLVPDEPGVRQELIRGEVHTMSLPGGRHGKVAMKAGRLLGNHVEAHDLGETFAAETGFIVERGPDTVRGADVAFVRRERLALITEPEEHVPFAPDLVVEVRLPDERPGDIAETTREWLAAGALLVWNVEPEARTATVHRPGAEPVNVSETEDLDGGEVVPGFRCRLGDLFA